MKIQRDLERLDQVNSTPQSRALLQAAQERLDFNRLAVRLGFPAFIVTAIAAWWFGVWSLRAAIKGKGHPGAEAAPPDSG